LSIYEESLLPLTPVSFPWLNRLQEQCRRRNDREAWLAREKRVARLVRQIQWAEKCLPRLNLLLRRNLYNSARSQLPVQVLNEEPYVILCQFLAGSPLTLIGMAVDLDQFCKSLETKIARIDWLPVEVLIQIQRQAPGIPLNPGVSAKDAPAPEFAVETRDSSKKEPVRPVTTHYLQETRILDPWAPQFIAQARLRDYRAFERRSLQKNLLYFSIVMLTITSCVLVLFFGNRALKEQQRLSKLRTDFLTNVSHELKTPLTAIRLHAETLERQSSGNIAPASSSLETIVEEVDRLSALINDVLEFTRLENDKKRYVWESVDLVPVIQESIQLFSQQLGESHFKVVLDLPESLVLSKADRAALKQCAVNLLSNSLKFSPDEKYLAIRLAHEDKQAIWEVEDRGIGVDPRDRPHIFEKFYRGSSLDPALSGTGLGLTLCKAFIEAHGGQITYDGNRSGKGSRFVIRLPIQDNRREPG
jgi:signal transduction histidine kinase